MIQQLFDRWFAGWIFDMDGAIIDRSRPIRAGLGGWAKRQGLDPQEVYHYSHSRQLRDTLGWVASTYRPGLDIGAAVAEIHECELAAAADTVAIDGAVDLLTRLQSKLTPWAVTTSCAHPVTYLEHAGLPQPPVLVKAGDVPKGRGKPHPDGFLLAAERLEVPPAECLVLGDAQPDIGGARAAGMAVVVTTYTLPREELTEADLCVSGLRDLRLEFEGRRFRLLPPSN